MDDRKLGPMILGPMAYRALCDELGYTPPPEAVVCSAEIPAGTVVHLSGEDVDLADMASKSGTLVLNRRARHFERRNLAVRRNAIYCRARKTDRPTITRDRLKALRSALGR